MTTTAAHQARTAALRAARTKDSTQKRQQVVAAIETLETAGLPITFTAVVTTAGVSTWLVYAQGVREHIDTARLRQATNTLPASCRPANSQPTTPASLRTDLAIARQEIGRLRAERDLLLHRLRHQIGVEIEGPDKHRLLARVADLETINRQLVTERDTSTVEAHAATHKMNELEDDLTAARESLRRVIKDQNRTRTATNDTD